MNDKIAIETEQMFELCDRENKGYLIPNDLKAVCPQLDAKDIDFIFASLDTDASGRIDRKEFLSGFQNALNEGEVSGLFGVTRRASVGESPCALNHVLDTATNSEIFDEIILKSADEDNSIRHQKLGNELFSNSNCEWINLCISSTSQDELLNLYEDIQTYGTQELLQRYENIITNFCKEMNERTKENERLQKIFVSERESYNSRLRELETEIDNQIAEAEHKVRAEESEKFIITKRELQDRMEIELEELRQNITRMENSEKVLKDEIVRDGRTEQLHAKIDELTMDNESLKSNLADSNLELTLIKSELAAIRTDYETERQEILSDNKIAMGNIKKTDDLQQKLQLLYDANKNLNDTNDSLRAVLGHRNYATRQSEFVRSCSPSALSQESNSDTVLHRPNNFSTDEDADSGLFLPIHPATSRLKLANPMEESMDDATSVAERTFRVVMCGEASVGKSSIVKRIITNNFAENLPATLGIDFSLKMAKIDGKSVAVQIWDTAGQERYRSLCGSYFRRADGAFLVYDCTSERSFLRVRHWLNTIMESTARSIPVLLCANKVDLRDSAKHGSIQCISAGEGARAARAIGVLFSECSALSGENLHGAFHMLIRELMAAEDVEVRDSTILLSRKTNKSSCCSR